MEGRGGGYMYICTMYNTQYVQYAMGGGGGYILCTYVQCIIHYMYNTQWEAVVDKYCVHMYTIHNMYNTLYVALCIFCVYTLYSVLHGIQCTVYNVQCTLYN